MNSVKTIDQFTSSQLARKIYYSYLDNEGAFIGAKALEMKNSSYHSAKGIVEKYLRYLEENGVEPFRIKAAEPYEKDYEGLRKPTLVNVKEVDRNFTLKNNENLCNFTELCEKLQNITENYEDLQKFTENYGNLQSEMETLRNEMKTLRDFTENYEDLQKEIEALRNELSTFSEVKEFLSKLDKATITVTSLEKMTYEQKEREADSKVKQLEKELNDLKKGDVENRYADLKKNYDKMVEEIERMVKWDQDLTRSSKAALKEIIGKEDIVEKDPRAVALGF